MVFSINSLLQVQCLAVKRSPLEVGYVTFPNEIVKHKNTAISIEKEVAEVTVPIKASGISQHIQEWIPGRIHHHSFIPAHIHHIYVPVLITRHLQAVLVKPRESLYLYPRHYGGYGAGSYAGGQGAGHGFQIVFNS